MPHKSNPILFRPSTVRLLLFGSSPSTIPRFVMTVVVDAINRMFGCRSRSDISKEFIKIFVEDFDSSTTPVFKVSGIFRISTPGSHRTPYHPFRMFSLIHSAAGGLYDFARLIVKSPAIFALRFQTIFTTLVFAKETFIFPLVTFGTLLHTTLYTQCIGGLT
ncbi:hypothetical protein LCGC14_1831390 [marine sediment metagenome]|uniref:Uncharacterized protein n=1 Tax=marine sediment metagenome TaxID=412755 RepID=A0A0F9JFG6_9ZZZZ